MKTQIAYISLGSNLGDTNKNLSNACDHIENLHNTKILKKSSIYLTEPQGLKDQPWFANQVLKVKVQDMEPITFLHKLLKIEIFMGRKRNTRWGPRIIDLDLILFENKIINTKELTLPHPRMIKRAFVLVPLLEISPEVKLPSGEEVKKYLQKINFVQKDNKLWQK